MTEKEGQPINEQDTMVNVFFHKASGQFIITELTDQGKQSTSTAPPGDWSEWTNYMEPSEMYEKLKEIFGV